MAAQAKANRGRSELVFVPLGGVGEIGMNVYLYGVGPEAQRRWLMVDLGITFPHEHEPGIDVVLPDLAFIEAQRKSLEAIVLTHAHEDHLGAVIELWPRLRVPIYATPFTAAFLRAKLRDDRPDLDLPIREVRMGGTIEAGPFRIELVTMAHSIPEPNALAIRTEHGLVFHTADWKIDPDPIAGPPTDEARIRALGAEGIAALVCDSTNAFREGISPSEIEVGKTIAGIVADAGKAVAVTIFASNVARIRSVMAAARAAGRELIVVGRAMHRIVAVAKETGYIGLDAEFHDQTAFRRLPRERVLMLLTGSQGEPRAALARIAAGEHPDVQLARGDTVIFSSRTIPGNEGAVGEIQNRLADRGVDVITDAQALVHVTGHPRRGELERMYEWCKPACLIPMHGEARHLEEQARFATARGVPHVVHARNGTLVRIAPGPAAIIGEVPVGRLHRDGRVVVNEEQGVVRERRRLAFAGIVMVAFAVERNGDLASDVQVMIDGIPPTLNDGSSMEDRIIDAVEGALDSIPRARRKDHSVVIEAAQRAARAAVNEAWGKKPICKVLVTPI